MPEYESAVNFYFHLTVGVLMFAMVAVMVGVTVAGRISARKLEVHLDWILGLPAESVKVWVFEFEAEYETGKYTEYTLYAQAKGQPHVGITENHAHVKYALNRLAKAGRPVQSAPKWLLDS